MSCVCVCVPRERERETGLHHSGVYSASEIILIVACVQTHTSFITVSVTRLCSPFGLELDYGKGHTFPTQLVVFGQSQCTVSVGQSEQTVLVGRWSFVENKVFERGGA